MRGIASISRNRLANESERVTDRKFANRGDEKKHRNANDLCFPSHETS